MDTKTISAVSGAALLAMSGTAIAGPMTVASSQVITPPTQIEPAHYYYHRHHYRHYGWRHHHHHYVWHHHRYHRYYAWNPAAAVVGGAIGLATFPFALATGAWPYYGYTYPGYPYYAYYPYYYYY